MNRSARSVTAVTVVALIAVLAVACGGHSTPIAGATKSAVTGSDSPSPSGTVIVGSANFPENELLADIYLDALAAKGIKTSGRIGVGDRQTYYPLVEKGEIDIVPEYNGALLAYLDPSAAPSTEAQTNADLASKLAPSLELAKAAGAQDTDALVVTRATARRYHLTSITSLARYAASFTIGGAAAFRTNHQGLAGLRSGYRLSFKKFSALDESGPLTIAALTAGSIQVGEIYTTDPSIGADHFVALSDPLDLFGSENITPLVNRSAATPAVLGVVNAVSAALNTPRLAAMVADVVGRHVAAATVARTFIDSVGLGS